MNIVDYLSMLFYLAGLVCLGLLFYGYNKIPYLDVTAIYLMLVGNFLMIFGLRMALIPPKINPIPSVKPKLTENEKLAERLREEGW